MSKFTDSSTGATEIDGYPCINSISLDGFEKKLEVKADENYVYLPMFDRNESSIFAYYLKIDKRILQIGEVQG